MPYTQTLVPAVLAVTVLADLPQAALAASLAGFLLAKSAFLQVELPLAVPAFPLPVLPQDPIVSTSEIKGGPAQGMRTRYASLPEAMEPETDCTIILLRVIGLVDQQKNQTYNYWPFAADDLFTTSGERRLDSLTNLKFTLIS